MVSGGGARNTQPRISDMDRKYFKEIFNLEARMYDGHRDKRIDYEALIRIFKMVGFDPNPKQQQEFIDMFAHNNGTLNLQEFLNVFSLKSNPQFKEVDVKNAFRLLSKEYDRPGMIRLERVKEILQEMGITDMEIVQLTTQLQVLCNAEGYFNFEDFVTSAF